MAKRTNTKRTRGPFERLMPSAASKRGIASKRRKLAKLRKRGHEAKAGYLARQHDTGPHERLNPKAEYRYQAVWKEDGTDHAGPLRFDRHMANSDLHVAVSIGRRHKRKLTGLRILKLRQNPGTGAFDRCVRQVAAKGSAYDPKAVCAAAGRKKYGKAKFQAMAAAGKKKKTRARRRNEPKPAHTAYDYGFSEGTADRKGDAARRRADHEGYVAWARDYPSHRAALQREWRRGFKDASRKNPGRRRRNPEDAAAARYEEFHGRPPAEVVEVTERLHEHGVLSGIGKLVKLVILSVDGQTEVELSKFGGALLAQDEKGTQLFIKGGDQRVNLADFGIRGRTHENEVLGAVREVEYLTTKDHLGKDGGRAIYHHKFGARGSRLPIATYDTRNHLLLIAGGGYDLPEVGIRG